MDPYIKEIERLQKLFDEVEANDDICNGELPKVMMTFVRTIFMVAILNSE